jgi:hypothetical protein
MEKMDPLMAEKVTKNKGSQMGQAITPKNSLKIVYSLDRHLYAECSKKLNRIRIFFLSSSH